MHTFYTSTYFTFDEEHCIESYESPLVDPSCTSVASVDPPLFPAKLPNIVVASNLEFLVCLPSPCRGEFRTAKILIEIQVVPEIFQSEKSKIPYFGFNGYFFDTKPHSPIMSCVKIKISSTSFWFNFVSWSQKW